MFSVFGAVYDFVRTFRGLAGAKRDAEVIRLYAALHNKPWTKESDLILAGHQDFELILKRGRGNLLTAGRGCLHHSAGRLQTFPKSSILCFQICESSQNLLH